MLLPDAAGMEELGLLGTGAPGLQENPEMLFFLWGPGPLGRAVAVTWGLPLLAPCGTLEGRGSCVQARAAQPGVGRRFMARIPKE